MTEIISFHNNIIVIPRSKLSMTIEKIILLNDDVMESRQLDQHCKARIYNNKQNNQFL